MSGLHGSDLADSRTLCMGLSPARAPGGARPKSRLLSHAACEHQATGAGAGRAWTQCPPTQIARPPPSGPSCPSHACGTPTPALVTLRPPWGLTPSLPDQGALKVPLPVPTPSPLRIPSPGALGVGTAWAPFHPPYPPPPVGAQLIELVPRALTLGPRPSRNPLTRLALGLGEP